MDPPRSHVDHQTISSDERWTNEKLFHHLNSLEASFVRRMLIGTGRRLLLRHLPDRSESNLVSKLMLERGENNAVSVNFVGTRSTVVNGRPEKRLRRHSPQPYDDSSEDDQVVPQISYRNASTVTSATAAIQLRN